MRKAISVLLVALVVAGSLGGYVRPQPAQAFVPLIVDGAVVGTEAEVSAFMLALGNYEAEGLTFNAIVDGHAAAAAADVTVAQWLVARQVVCGLLVVAMGTGQVAGAFGSHPFDPADSTNQVTQAYIATLRRTGDLGKLQNAVDGKITVGSADYLDLSKLLHMSYYSGGEISTHLPPPFLCAKRDGLALTGDELHAVEYVSMVARTMGYVSSDTTTSVTQAYGSVAVFPGGWVLSWGGNINGYLPSDMVLFNNSVDWVNMADRLQSDWRTDPRIAPVAPHDFSTDPIVLALAGSQGGKIIAKVPTAIGTAAAGEPGIPSGLGTTKGTVFPGEGQKPGYVPQVVTDPSTTNDPNANGTASNPFSLDWGPLFSFLTGPLNLIIALLRQVVDAVVGFYNFFVTGTWLTELLNFFVPTETATLTAMRSELNTIVALLETTWPWALIPLIGGLPTLWQTATGGVPLAVDFDMARNVHVHFDMVPPLTAYVLPMRPWLVAFVWFMLVASVIKFLRPRIHA